MEVVILGCHRSGTSLLAGMLHHLGVFMGNDLIGPNWANEGGYYEDRAFVRLNEHILTDMRIGWAKPNISAGMFGQVKNAQKKQAMQLVWKRNKSYTHWGWKDPRTVLTLPIYLPHLSFPKFIVIERDFEATVSSLDAREKKKGRAECEMITNKYLHRIEYWRNTLRHHHVRFEDIIREPEVHAYRLAGWLDLPAKERNIKDTINWVNPSYNHWSEI